MVIAHIGQYLAVRPTFGQNPPMHPRLFNRVAVAVLALAYVLIVLAHPEDEFCTPGDDSLDPDLCRSLAALNAEDGSLTGAEAIPVLDADGNVRGFWPTAALYVSIGVRHILPGGLDHILFVVAVLLAVTSLRSIVIQISAFTVAHTATLGLAASGVIAPPAAIVEPLIALTIAFVAIENLFVDQVPRWRPLVVFAFGLIHGMGFAGFFGELGLPPEQFWSALIGFNVGVEVGQLLIVAAGALLAIAARRWLPEKQRARHYRRCVVVPGSLIIGAFGLWWTAERVLSAI